MRISPSTLRGRQSSPGQTDLLLQRRGSGPRAPALGQLLGKKLVTPPPAGADPDVLEGWGAALEGWDAQSILPSWLRHKAPIGIPEEVETDGVFPPCHGDEPQRNPASLYTCLAGWSNYTRTSFRSSSNFCRPKKPGATASSWIPWTNSIATRVGGHVVLSKLGLVTKLEPDRSPK